MLQFEEKTTLSSEKQMFKSQLLNEKAFLWLTSRSSKPTSPRGLQEHLLTSLSICFKVCQEATLLHTKLCMCTIQSKVVAEINTQRHPIKQVCFLLKGCFCIFSAMELYQNFETSRKMCLI